ncbi:MAG TPA: AzlC family ABC transporter permease, partial [Anaerolineales bacterium]|nr:AzlC family ABC transporter permease [Anaerolineales bacterium]
PRREFLTGVRDQLPLLLGVIPFGLIFGALAISVGVSPAAAQGFSLFVFAGSAQFIAVSLIGESASALVVIATIALVNLRHALYSASLAPSLAKLGRTWKLALGWLLTDEAFAMASRRYRNGELEDAHWYTLGTGLTLWAGWQISTAVGIALGSNLPQGLSLDFALPLTFLALVVPSLIDRPTLAAALAAGLLGLALFNLPFRLGLVAATIAGVGLGLALESATQPRDEGTLG